MSQFLVLLAYLSAWDQHESEDRLVVRSYSQDWWFYCPFQRAFRSTKQVQCFGCLPCLPYIQVSIDWVVPSIDCSGSLAPWSSLPFLWFYFCKARNCLHPPLNCRFTAFSAITLPRTPKPWSASPVRNFSVASPIFPTNHLVDRLSFELQRRWNFGNYSQAESRISKPIFHSLWSFNAIFYFPLIPHHTFLW